MTAAPFSTIVLPGPLPGFPGFYAKAYTCAIHDQLAEGFHALQQEPRASEEATRRAVELLTDRFEIPAEPDPIFRNWLEGIGEYSRGFHLRSVYHLTAASIFRIEGGNFRRIETRRLPDNLRTKVSQALEEAERAILRTLDKWQDAIERQNTALGIDQ